MKSSGELLGTSLASQSPHIRQLMCMNAVTTQPWVEDRVAEKDTENISLLQECHQIACKLSVPICSIPK